MLPGNGGDDGGKGAQAAYPSTIVRHLFNDLIYVRDCYIRIVGVKKHHYRLTGRVVGLYIAFNKFLS